MTAMSLTRAFRPGAFASRGAGLAALAGAAVWFAVYVGPQWGFVGQGYRPNAIALGALLIAAGLAVRLAQTRSGDSRLNAGLGLALAVAIAVGLDAALGLGALPDAWRGLVSYTAIVIVGVSAAVGIVLVAFPVSLSVRWSRAAA